MGASSGGKGKRVAQHKAAAVEKARHYGNRRRSRRSHLPRLLNLIVPVRISPDSSYALIAMHS